MYAAETPVDIPSDGAYHSVPLLKQAAPVELGYVVVPRESTDVFRRVRTRWDRLAAPDRRRVHLVRVPMDDPAENAVTVNAIQRRSDVVVQKSLAEGFGLTVAEAMWKRRPVVASRIGGIQDQVEHGVSGLLVDDPTDLPAFGAAVRTVLADPAGARRIGEAAHRRVCDRFLPAHLWAAEADVVERALTGADRVPTR